MDGGGGHIEAKTHRGGHVFALKVDAIGGDHLRVLLTRSPEGEAEGELPADLVAQIEEARRASSGGTGVLAATSPRREVERPDAAGATAEVVARRLGEILFRGLLRDEIGRLYERSVARVEAVAGGRLRIQLHFDLAEPRTARVAGLPWELMFDPRAERFLALDRRLSLVRHVDAPVAHRALRLRSPVRILLAAAQPLDAVPLDLDGEARRIHQAWQRRSPAAPRPLDVDELAHATPRLLRERLLDGGHQVLHFMGHGSFEAGGGSLLLEREGGSLQPVDAGGLRELFHGIDDLGLVVLNACHAGRVATADANAGRWSRGVAAALVTAGVPAVVAMQAPLTDAAALAFAESFYSRLAAGDPIDLAVTEARVRMRQDGSAEWATPVLFQRGAQSDAASAGLPPPPPRHRFSPPPPPDELVERPEEMERLVSLLLSPAQGGPVALVAALQGTGGYGKTTLAQAACRDPRVRDAFEEVLWVTVGEQPSNLVGMVEDLVAHLQGSRPGFSDLEIAAGHLGGLLEDRRLLLVIDDVWQPSHLYPWLRGGAGCVRLVTTRDRTVLPLRSALVSVDAMQEAQAVDLLSRGLPDGNELAFRRLSATLGSWPLLLNLVKGVLRDRVTQLGQWLPDALVYVHQALVERGLTAFDVSDPDHRQRAVAASLEVSLDQLPAAVATCYRQLAVFPPDVAIPLATLEILWDDPGGVETEQRCVRLDQMSLVQELDLSARTLRLHDVVRAYLVRRQGFDAVRENRRLLDAHQRRIGADPDPEGAWPWHRLPAAEPYLLRHLIHHLVGAGRDAVALRTAKELRFLAARIARGQVHAVDEDLATLRERAPADGEVFALHTIVCHFQHLLRDADPHVVLANLLLRCHGRDELTAVVATAPERVGWSARPRFRLPDTPHPALVRTLVGHDVFPLTDCAVSADGRRVATASEDGTSVVWDALRGIPLLRLEPWGHSFANLDEDDEDLEQTVAVYCDLSSDGETVLLATEVEVSVSHVASGVRQVLLDDDPGGVSGCALSGDARQAACAYQTGLVRVWDLPQGRLRWEWQGDGRARGGCAFDGEASILAVCAASGVELRAVDTGRHLVTIETGGSGQSYCDLHPSGRFAGVATDAGVRVFETATGAEIAGVPVTHVPMSPRAAFVPGSDWIVFEESLLRLGLWSWRAQERTASLFGHHGHLTCCAASNADFGMVTGDHDGHLLQWSRSRIPAPAGGCDHAGFFGICAVTVDGDHLLLGEENRSVGVWDPVTGRRSSRLEVGTALLAFHPLAGERVVTADREGGIRVWDLAAEHPTQLPVEWKGLSAAFAASDGSLYAAFRDRLQAWAFPDLQPTLTLETGIPAPQSCAASADGRWIALTGNDRHLRLWDLEAGGPPRLLEGPVRPLACAFTGDGRLATGWEGETIRIWNPDTASLDRLLETRGDFVVGLAARGHHLVSVSRAGSLEMVQIWDLDDGRCLLADPIPKSRRRAVPGCQRATRSWCPASRASTCWT